MRVLEASDGDLRTLAFYGTDQAWQTTEESDVPWLSGGEGSPVEAGATLDSLE